MRSFEFRGDAVASVVNALFALWKGIDRKRTGQAEETGDFHARLKRYECNDSLTETLQRYELFKNKS